MASVVEATFAPIEPYWLTGRKTASELHFARPGLVEVHVEDMLCAPARPPSCPSRARRALARQGCFPHPPDDGP